MNAAIETTKTVRYIYKCRYNQCKHVFAFDYELVSESRYGTIAYRLLEDGTKRYVTEDVNNGLRCPLCDSYLPKSTRVNGHYSEKRVCNARCLTATGGDCECQCSGKNHGANHL